LSAKLARPGPSSEPALLTGTVVNLNSSTPGTGRHCSNDHRLQFGCGLFFSNGTAIGHPGEHVFGIQIVIAHGLFGFQRMGQRLRSHVPPDLGTGRGIHVSRLVFPDSASSIWWPLMLKSRSAGPCTQCSAMGSRVCRHRISEIMVEHHEWEPSALCYFAPVHESPVLI